VGPERFRLVRYDARGHGRSPVPPGPYELDELAEDALALLDRLEIERTHICGLSLGGMTAMWLGIHAPERVDRLVLCCTSARLGPPEMWSERATLVRAEGSDAVADAGVGRWLTDDYSAANPDTAAWLRAMIAATPAEGYASACTAIEHMDLLADLPRIAAPTLVIAGAQDPSTPPAEHAQLIADRIPGARIEILDPAAHLANVERADDVTRLVLQHLG
jgi:3-oxoadipate enol-lactonase